MTIVDATTGEILDQHDDAMLARLDTAAAALAGIETVEDAKAFLDTALAIQVWTQRQQRGIEVQNRGAIIVLRAKRRLGELLAEMEMQPGRPAKNGCSVQPFSRLSDLGIEKTAAHRAQKVAAVSPEDFEEYIETARDRGEEITTAGLLRTQKGKTEQHMKNLREREERDAAARTAEHKPVITLASWDAWLPNQESCDLLLTDPPYATDVPDITTFAHAWLPAALAKIKPTGRAYVCIGAYPDELRAYLTADHAHMHLAQVLVWTYRNTLGPSPVYDYKLNWQAILYFRGPDAPALTCETMIEQFSVQDINAPDGRQGDRYHAWQKPEQLAERLIRHSTEPGARVHDVFSGTGTFVLTAHRLGRQASGCETNPDMLAIAEQRGVAACATM